MITSDDSLIHNLDSSSPSFVKTTKDGISYLTLVFLLVGVVVFGVVIGFFGSKMKGTKSSSMEKVNVEKIAGIADKKTFKDSAEGILNEGGIDGEGNFHLERPGGESQNVYLTSTTVDLSKYVGKKVRVWGATFQGEKAGWLMDVGLVELL
ncbi:hypothetical protein HY041_03260 [Candidatus Roizmanbacteria bacterium]|nr:hypothetical protein [Candidatus Roizmanbacteria bacterium]